jgi:metal-sulfur cluster biosynthetic enzyme
VETEKNKEQPVMDPRPLRDRVIEILKTCYDPEIPVDIYELGLIYEINVLDGKIFILK